MGVASIAVASANGFAGTVEHPYANAVITLTTTVTGLLKGNGTAISAAVAGTDYQAPGNYITALSGDGTAAGPGAAALSAVKASSLKSASSTIDVASAAAPTAGQVLTATGGAAATWQTPTVGTVTTLSVASANGFGGSVANPSTAPAITLTTTVTGLLKGNGTAISAAVAGTDYQAPGNYITALSGDVVAAGPGSVGATIQPSAVTYSKLDDIITIQQADFALTNTASAQAIFASGQSGAALAASTTYLVEALLIVSAPTNAVTKSLVLPIAGGSWTTVSLFYLAYLNPTSNGANPISGNQGTITQSTATNIGGGAQRHAIKIWGELVTNSAGTFTPQFQYSGVPGATPGSVLTGSYMRLTRLGASTFVKQGFA